MQALEDLDYLAALDDNGDLSDLGVILSEFPLPPELAKALLAACEFDCVDEMLTLAAMLTGITPLSLAPSPIQSFHLVFWCSKGQPFPMLQSLPLAVPTEPGLISYLSRLFSHFLLLVLPLNMLQTTLSVVTKTHTPLSQPCTPLQLDSIISILLHLTLAHCIQLQAHHSTGTAFGSPVASQTPSPVNTFEPLFMTF